MDKNDFRELLASISLNPIMDWSSGCINDTPFNVVPIEGIKPERKCFGYVWIRKNDGKVDKWWCPSVEFRNLLINGCTKEGYKHLSSDKMYYFVRIKGMFICNVDLTTIEIDNKELYELCYNKPEVEVISRFNQTLYEYALEKVKTSVMSTKSSEWQLTLDKTIEWFDHTLNPDINDYKSLIYDTCDNSFNRQNSKSEEKIENKENILTTWQDSLFFKVNDIEYELTPQQATIFKYIADQFHDGRTFNGRKVIEALGFKGNESLQPYFKDNMNAFKILFDPQGKRGNYCFKFKMAISE